VRGRKPKPTALKRLEGNPGRRPLNQQEPRPADVSRLRPPSYLRPDARRIWRALAAELQAVGLFTRLDVPKVDVLAVALAEHRRCYEALYQAIEAQPTADTSRLQRALRQQAETVKSLSSGFGMDPSDRVRLAVAPRPDPSDPFVEFDAARPQPDRPTKH
jgi:P27 family predicted phage terminase small subunit